MSFYPLASVNAGGIKFKTSTVLLPPDPLPPGVSPNAYGKAIVETEAGREKLKLEVQDVEVIGDVADPEFCNGFYEVVLSNLDRTEEFALPSFPGMIVVCLEPGNAQGPTVGNLNFDAKLDQGQPPFDPRGKLLSIWMVEPVRDPLTGFALAGPNGEPFMIESRIAVALEGILK